LTVTPTGSANSINLTYTFKQPLTADGTFDVMTSAESRPIGYQTPLLAHGNLDGVTAANFDNAWTVSNPAALVDAGPFGVSFDGTNWTFQAGSDPSATGPYARPTTVIQAGGTATGFTMTLDNGTTTTDIVYTFNPALTATAADPVNFSFYTAAYDPNENAYANATISGDEKHVMIDMHENEERTTDIEFKFEKPLAKGAGASNSSISFDIKGSTAWQAQEVNDQGYYEFMADFLGGTNGVTEQYIDFNIGAKNDGTGRFVSDSLTTTQYARASTTTFQNANGYGAGDLEGVEVSTDGVMTGIYSNGELIPLYRVALAKFLNNQGLFKAGGNLFRETRDSGSPITNKPGTNGLGSISPNSLEMSNVDMSDEFVNMIVTQRGFQANSKIVTTIDTLLGEVINMKR
jgi:flagellar hook protein FlgE